MWIELYINGELNRSWFFENGNFKEPFCEAGFEEKRRMWEEIRLKCLLEVSQEIDLYLVERFELIVTVHARIQPADITDQEYQLFLDQLANARETKYNINKFLKS